MLFKYLWYIIKHKWYVMIECFKIGLIWRGLTHDLSKFLPCEFFPYMRYFYGKDKKSPEEKIQIEKNFNLAWLKHQKGNKHHWQYWILLCDNGKEIPLEMPRNYIKEMICDWRGAGKAINGKDDIKEWYKNNKTKMQLETNTRAIVEVMLEI